MAQLFKEKYLFRTLLLILIFSSLYIYNDRVATDERISRQTQKRMAILRTLGGPAIPIIAQCCISRNLAEGIYARRSDIPGGFCFHSDCDVVVTPGALSERLYSFKVIRSNP